MTERFAVYIEGFALENPNLKLSGFYTKAGNLWGFAPYIGNATVIEGRDACFLFIKQLMEVNDNITHARAVKLKKRGKTYVNG